MLSSMRFGLIVFFLVAIASAAAAVPRQMGGVLTISNPSVSGQALERPPSTKFTTIDVGTPTAGYTQVGNSINLEENVFPIGPGGLFRSFPNIVFVAQLTGTYYSPQQAANFVAGGGAANDGPISFCPPVATLVGGWTACTFYASPNNPTASPASNNRTARVHIEQAGNFNAFGGVLTVLRGLTQGVWFVKAPFPEPPLAGKAAVVSRAPRTVTVPWPGGLDNFDAVSSPRPNGPRYDVTLTTDGKINQFLTTPACGTPPCPLPTLTSPTVGGESFGFRMTTGLVSQSDAYPPNNETTPFFFVVTQGRDSTAMTASGGTNRNIVLLGGSIAFSPAGGGSNFIRLTKLAMTIPEPGTSAALAAGVVLLVGLVHLRRRNP